MDFRLTEDQLALRTGFQELLEGRFGRDRLQAAVEGPPLDRGLWRELGEAGFFALRLAEADGGVGLGLQEAVLLFEVAGGALLPGPLVATHLAVTYGAVPGADGALEGGSAEAPPMGPVVTALEPSGLIEHLESADAVLVGSESGAPVAAVRPAELPSAPLRSVDPLTPLCRLRSGAEGREAPGPPQGPVRREAALLTAALQLGSAARTVSAAVRYAREREQFGRPIGAFQAIKHLCARMLVRAELARAAVYAAAVTEAPHDIAGAKLLADEAAVSNARDCLQVHGGMGFTWEADVHLHLKRAWVRKEQWQSAHEAEDLLADGLIDELSP
ncbi:acyl-CoA dehydrogenase family protein [Streptomyces pathocidini]|uniref:acyl-CoA dehydrogenase family protein n=1 Tax=Streptomyces pathocidini TaxID=1650571 RepID=UPI0033EF64CE